MSAYLTRDEYTAACGYAGGWLDREEPTLRNPVDTTGIACGVYILCRACPQTSRPQVCYVGKADRRLSQGDVAQRLRDHKASEKGPVVRWAAVIPLREDTPPEEVAQIEGNVARYFGVPRLNFAVPARRTRPLA